MNINIDIGYGHDFANEKVDVFYFYAYLHKIFAFLKNIFVNISTQKKNILGGYSRA